MMKQNFRGLPVFHLCIALPRQALTLHLDKCLRNCNGYTPVPGVIQERQIVCICVPVAEIVHSTA